jgi:hypothetical protein
MLPFVVSTTMPQFYPQGISMNTTRLFLCTAFLFAAFPLLAKEPDAFYYAKPQAFAQTAFVQKLTSLPEWNAFRNQACDAIDKAVNRNLTDQQNLDKVLPPALADQVASRHFSIREVADKLTQYLEAVIVMAEENDSREFDGVVALIGNVDPSNGLGYLQMIDDIQEGKDYKFLKKDASGDFIIQVSTQFRERTIEFGCAGLKLPGNNNRYALLFARNAGIQKYYEAFKKGQTGEEYAKGYAQKLVVNDRCFRSLERFGQKQGWANRVMEVCKRIKGVEMGYRDVDGTTQIEVGVSLSQEDEANAVKDLVLGASMFVELAAVAKEETAAETKDMARQAANFLKTIKAEANGNKVAVTVKLDDSNLWKLVSAGLKKGSDELSQKKDYSSLREEIQRSIMSIVQ